MHIRLGINIVLLGGDKGIDTKVEGGVEILIVNSSLPGLFHRIKTRGRYDRVSDQPFISISLRPQNSDGL